MAELEFYPRHFEASPYSLWFCPGLLGQLEYVHKYASGMCLNVFFLLKEEGICKGM